MKLAHVPTVLIALIAAGGAAPLAQQHVMQTPAEMKWGPAPPMLPAGAEIAVLAGDPMADSPFTIRLKFPASYKIPAHSHPKDEHVTVLSGALFIGMGDKLDAAAGKQLGVGSFALMPAAVNHFAYTKVPTTILLHGQGPVEFKYVNPADDPRNKK